MDTLAHGRRLDAEDICDFGGGELFQITQHKCTAIELRESIERSRRCFRGVRDSLPGPQRCPTPGGTRRSVSLVSLETVYSPPPSLPVGRSPP